MSVIVNGKKYHIALTRNGVTYGFMIRKGSDTRRRLGDWAPNYSTGDDQFAEGTWRPVSWDDFSGGVGQERYAQTTKTQFYTSKDAETRLTKRLTLGGRWIDTDLAQTATANPVDFLGNIYVPCGTALRKLTVSTGVWSQVGGAFGASITHLFVWGAVLYIALGSGTDAWKYDGTTFTLLTGIKANNWAYFNALLWRALANNIYSTSDGTTWSAALAIGDASTNVNGMREYSEGLYCAKDDKLWVTDGTAINTKKKLDYSHQTYVGNGKFITEWGGYLWFNILRRVIQYSTTTWNDRTPTITGDANKENYGFGVPVMFVDAPTALLVAFDGGENQYAGVMAYNGTGWHQLYGPVTGTMAAVGYSRAADWIVVNDAPPGLSGATRYQAQIAQADTCTADYAANAEIVLPWFDGGYPWFKKGGRSIVVETRDCTSTETVTVYYRKDNQTTYTALASAVVSSNAPTEIALDAINGAIEFYKIQVKLVLARGSDTSKRPTVTNVTLRYMNRPTAVHAYTVDVRLSNRQKTIV